MLSGVDQEDILHRARRFDTHALAQIHDRYYPEVYRYVRFRLYNDQVCEDIASEVFLRLLDALNKNRGSKPKFSWLAIRHCFKPGQ
jgi:RNA polymerase sigma-70 factor (ECF subfamily)